MFKLSKLKILLTGIALCFVIPTTASAATYTVTSNDSLFKIGSLFNMSYNTLMINNNLSSTAIYPGQKLDVPASKYSVQAGDSLYKIAIKFNTSIDWLKKVNGLSTDMIYVGQTIFVPFHYSYTQSEVDLLARLITAEAQGEPYKAKVAVGAVVLNRIKSPIFPQTIKDVIYEKNGSYYQFTPVLNGWINKPADSDSIKAAYESLNNVDPTNGALYYFDNSITNQWLLAKPVATTINNLIFAY